MLASLALIGVALMEPVLPYSQGEVQSRGLDIVMVLDLSSSMQENMEAYRPFSAPTGPVIVNPDGTLTMKPTGKTRLQATKDAIKAFVGQRRDDRIGLVVFSDHAYVVSPLTFDYDYLVRYVDLVDDRLLQGEGQTAIGDGLALANYLLARQSRGTSQGHQVIVLFTDGENNRGQDPLQALSASNDANIRVHFIGVDLEEDIGNKPEVRRLLQSVQRFGGRYFNANSERDLLAASSTIDSIEKGFLVNKVYVRDAPVYQWFAVPALICLGMAVGTRAIPYFLDRN
jgi:Ca-activated chloride channel family protein